MKVSLHLLMIAALGWGGAALATAQTVPNTPIQHVIMIIQENRTPTNLFLADQALINNGAHLVPSGSCHGTPIPLTALRMDSCLDPAHSHSYAWVPMYDEGKMDGACDIPPGLFKGCKIPRCSDTHYKYCPQYTYIPNT